MGWGGSHRELKAKPRVLARRVHVPCGRDDGCSFQATRPASAESELVPGTTAVYVENPIENFPALQKSRPRQETTPPPRQILGSGSTRTD